MMKRCVIFTAGRYRKNAVGAFKRLCESARTVAVDGGCRFFVAAGLAPDVIIGDLDSIKSLPGRFRERSRVLQSPEHKDKTDLQLALEQCLKEKVREVDIVTPEVGEIDHFLGNIALLSYISRLSEARSKPRIRIVGAEYEILWVHDDRRAFHDCAGDRLSVIPMSSAVTLTLRGMEYGATRLKIARGHSRGLRNRIVAQRASLRIKGKALLVHYFKAIR